jgi:hypothetical protein
LFFNIRMYVSSCGGDCVGVVFLCYFNNIMLHIIVFMFRQLCALHLAQRGNEIIVLGLSVRPSVRAKSQIFFYMKEIFLIMLNFSKQMDGVSNNMLVQFCLNNRSDIVDVTPVSIVTNSPIVKHRAFWVR